MSADSGADGQYGQYPAPRFTVAHLSDVHLLAHGVKQYGVVEPEAGSGCAGAAPPAGADAGRDGVHRRPGRQGRARGVRPASRAGRAGRDAVGAQVVWVMGNHDERAPYARGLFDSDDDGPAGPCLRRGRAAGRRPGHQRAGVPPRRAQPRAAGLAARGAEHAGRARHPAGDAPPADPGADDGGRGDDRAARPGPRSPRSSRAATCGCILGGHFHYSSYSTFAGIPVSVASASCYTTDPAPLERLVSGVDGHQAFTMAHVYDDRIVHTVVPLAEAPEVTGYPSTCAPRSEPSRRGAARDPLPQGLHLQRRLRGPLSAGVKPGRPASALRHGTPSRATRLSG